MQAVIHIQFNDFEPTCEGFYFYMKRNGTGRQWEYFQHALAKMAAKHPEADPREAILEYFAHHLHNYKNQLEEMKWKENI